jgi:hypothetical protein
VSSSLLGLLLLGAGLGLHLDENGELSMGRSVELLETVAEVIRFETGVLPVIDSPDWSDCQMQDDACQTLVRSRTRTDELILLRAYAGLTKIRVELVRLRNGAEPLTTRGDLPLEKESWALSLAPLVRPLFPDPLDPVLLGAREPNVVVVDPSGVQPRASRSPGPWILIGSSAVAAAFGIGFFASSQDARSELVSGRLFSSEEFDELNGRLETHSILSGILLGSAVSGLVAGVAWWVFE